MTADALKPNGGKIGSHFFHQSSWGDIRCARALRPGARPKKKGQNLFLRNQKRGEKTNSFGWVDLNAKHTGIPPALP